MGYALNRAPLVYDRPSPANRGLLGLKHPCDRTRKLPEAGQLGASLRLTFTRVQRCAMPWAARDGHVPTMIHRSLVLMGGEPNTERADTELRASVRRLEKAQAWRHPYLQSCRVSQAGNRPQRPRTQPHSGRGGAWLDEPSRFWSMGKHSARSMARELGTRVSSHRAQPADSHR